MPGPQTYTHPDSLTVRLELATRPRLPILQDIQEPAAEAGGGGLGVVWGIGVPTDPPLHPSITPPPLPPSFITSVLFKLMSGGIQNTPYMVKRLHEAGQPHSSQSAAALRSNAHGNT